LAFALASAQADFVMDTQPAPLQLFWPLQLFFADLHSEVPLHEFTPLQCTVASSAAKLVLVTAVENSIAAAAAMAALDVLLICMVQSSWFFRAAILLLNTQDPANGLIITQKQKLMLLGKYFKNCIRKHSLAECPTQ
jgi:hypothetical protein